MEHTTVTMTMVEYNSMLKERDDLLKNLKDARSGESHNGQLFERKQAQLLATLELVQVLVRGWAMEDETRGILNKVLSLSLTPNAKLSGAPNGASD